MAANAGRMLVGALLEEIEVDATVGVPRELSRHLRRRQQPNARGRQLDRQRKTADESTRLGDGRDVGVVEREPGVDELGVLDEHLHTRARQRLARGAVARRHREQCQATIAARNAPVRLVREHDRQPGAAAHQRAEHVAGIGDLGVIDGEHHPAVRDRLAEGVDRGRLARGRGPHAQRPRDLVHQRIAGGLLQVGPPHGQGVAIPLPHGLCEQGALADARPAGERDDGRVLIEDMANSAPRSFSRPTSPTAAPSRSCTPTAERCSADPMGEHVPLALTLGQERPGVSKGSRAGPRGRQAAPSSATGQSSDSARPCTSASACSTLAERTAAETSTPWARTNVRS